MAPPLRSAAVLSLPGLGPQPRAGSGPHAVPVTSPAPGSAGWGRPVGGGARGRRGQQAALGRARPRASQQVRSRESAHVRREEPAGGGGPRRPLVPGRVAGGMGCAGSSVFGDWRLCRVSLLLGSWLNPAAPRSGVGSGKHVEPSLPGGGSRYERVLPWKPPPRGQTGLRVCFNPRGSPPGVQDGDPFLPAARGLRLSEHSEVEQGRATRFPTRVSGPP